MPGTSLQKKLTNVIVAQQQLAGPDMLIDTYDQYNQQDNDVIDIAPDDASDGPVESPLRADDCKWLPSIMSSQHS